MAKLLLIFPRRVRCVSFLQGISSTLFLSAASSSQFDDRYPPALSKTIHIVLEPKSRRIQRNLYHAERVSLTHVLINSHDLDGRVYRSRNRSRNRLYPRDSSCIRHYCHTSRGRRRLPLRSSVRR